MFLPSPPALSTKSALFIAWGQLLTYDISLTRDNSSEPFDVPCNDGAFFEGVRGVLTVVRFRVDRVV